MPFKGLISGNKGFRFKAVWGLMLGFGDLVSRFQGSLGFDLSISGFRV